MLARPDWHGLISGRAVDRLARVEVRKCLVALTTTTISLGIGAVASYFGGKVDAVLSRLVDAIIAFPLLILLTTLAAVLGPNLWTVVMVIGVDNLGTLPRVVHAEVLSVREREFVLAARGAGANGVRIISASCQLGASFRDHRTSSSLRCGRCWRAFVTARRSTKV